MAIKRSHGSRLSTDLIDVLGPYLETCQRKNYKKKNIIFFQGEAPRNGYMIKRGVVKVYNITRNGESQLVTFIKDGEFFPASWLFEKTPNAVYFYEAATDCEVYSMHRDAFLRTIQQSPEAMMKIIDYYAGTYTSTLMQINALSQTRAREKVTYMLLYLTERFGIEKDQSTVVVELQMTHQQLASLVGLTRETITIELNRLKRNGIVQLVNHTYQVNMPKLQEALGEDAFFKV